MSHHQQQDHAAAHPVDGQEHLQDIYEVPEPVSGFNSRAASHPTLVGLDTHTTPSPTADSNALQHSTSPQRYTSHHEHEAHPPAAHRPHQTRRSSSVSHVDVDFFDPSGVHELKRTLTQQKAEEHHHNTPGERRPEEDEVDDAASMSTDATLRISDDGPFDFEKTLKRVIRKRGEANIKPRTLGVAFKDLHVVGLGASNSFLPTLGSMFNPKVILEQIQAARHPNLRDILQGFQGVVKPGEMLLVLGSPGSGCSTFLKTIANQRGEYHSVTGEVHYDSIEPDQLYKQFRGDVQYCPEDDIHFPTLSVATTLKFAAAARTPKTRIGRSRKEFAEAVTTMLTTIFGLRHVMSTPVGDAAIRGVSGGQKKRVSIAESLAARSCIGCWDNSTRGLDASTALEFVQALRIGTDTFEQTTLVSIYQAGESLYDHFDKVCVIYEGRMAYFGPADQARQYFIDMGYEPANRQTSADFLVAVTDSNGRIPRAGVTGQPRTAAEFAEYFQNSEMGKRNREEYEAYVAEFVNKPEKKNEYIESAHAEFAKRSHKGGPYLLSISQQAAIVMKRRVQIILGNKVATYMNLFSYVFQAVIIGSVFLRMEESTSAFFSRGGVIFFALLFSCLQTMAEIPALYSQRPIVSRHAKAAFYHPFVDALSMTLVDVPITATTSLVFSIILYFMVGLQKSADQFFIFVLFIFLCSITMRAFFRAIAAAFTSEATAQSVAGISVLGLSIYTGYNIPKPTMIGAMRWITYINPLKYSFEAMLTNEFRTLRGSCANLVPQGPGYENVALANQVCATVGAVPGEAYVNGERYLNLAYGFYWSNTWMNLGIVIAFMVGFIAILLFLTEINTSSSHETPVVLFKRNKKTKALTSKTTGGNDEEKNTLNEKLTAEAHAPPPTDALPPPMHDVFSWQNIRYTVPIKGEADRLLLSNVSGYVAPGRLTALMGESGAGKTTLLNVLAERTDTGVVTGDRFVNGQALPADFQSQSGYVQQMDTHVPFATVREALLFSAKLRQPPEVSDSEKIEWVERCLKICGLSAYAEASVGSLSLEFKKRTTIGVELAAKPKLLLFLDEPTSGLDSQSAWAIMSFLRTLADNGQAILCTIHQPSAELFQVFDRLLLLRKGGETVYMGDLGKNATKLIRYFETNGARECLPHENPAEYMLDVIGAGATATSTIDWHAVWKASKESVELQEELERLHTEGRNRPAIETTLHSEFATPWLYQTKELIKRDAIAHWRDPSYLMAKLSLNILASLFIGFTFFKSKDTIQGTQNKLFAIFMATILSVPLSNQLQVPYINMRTIYEIRERPSRMYSWTALVTSQIVVALPWNILGSIFLFFCWYFTVGFSPSRAGYTFLMIVVAYPAYYTTFAQAVAAMCPSAEIAAVLFSFLFSFVLTFNGVLQPYRLLGWWQWMYRLSPYTYLIEGLLGQAIGRREVTCSDVEYVTITPPSGLSCSEYMDPYMSFAGGYLRDPSATSDCQFCSIRTTDQFLGGNFNIYYENHWRDFGIMMAFVVFNFFLIFSMTYLFRIHKGSLLPSFRRKKN